MDDRAASAVKCNIASFGSRNTGTSLGAKVISGTVSHNAGRYFVSVLCETEMIKAYKLFSKEGWH